MPFETGEGRTMSATAWGKWYWSDWMSDPGVRASSYAARGLWMDLLCIAATADPTGYVSLNGRPLIASEIARLTGGHASEVEILLDELDRNGVFTRDRHGRIYSRRMLKDQKKAKISRKNGKTGGNPTLTKQRENPPWDNPPDKSRDKTQKPEARYQKPAASAATPAQAHETGPPVLESSINLRKRIAAAFQELAPNRLVPDTNRAAVWLAQGYPPDLIVSVIREGLGRKPDVGSLAYFDRRLEDAKRAGTPVAAGPEPIKTAPSPDQDRRHRLRLAIMHFRGEWRQGTDEQYRPESPGCTTPSDIVDEARATVAAERRASGREAA